MSIGLDGVHHEDERQRRGRHFSAPGARRSGSAGRTGSATVAQSPGDTMVYPSGPARRPRSGSRLLRLAGGRACCGRRGGWAGSRLLPGLRPRPAGPPQRRRTTGPRWPARCSTARARLIGEFFTSGAAWFPSTRCRSTWSGLRRRRGQLTSSSTGHRLHVASCGPPGRTCMAGRGWSRAPARSPSRW